MVCLCVGCAVRVSRVHVVCRTRVVHAVTLVRAAFLCVCVVCGACVACAVGVVSVVCL